MEQEMTGMERMAFIVIAHKQPQQVERLMKRLAHPGSDIYIHLDGKADIGQYAHLAEHPNVTFTPKRAKVNWAGYGMVESMLFGLEAVLGTGKQYSYIHLLSAQDYPLVGAGELHRFFREQKGKEFLDLWTDEYLDSMMVRIRNYSFEDWKIPGKYRLEKIVSGILPDRKTPLGLTTFGGSQWWSLTQPCAAYALSFISSSKELRDFYKYVWGGDEFIFQTVIMNSPFKNRVVNDNLRFIDWSSGKASPKTFGDEDYEAIMQSGKLFARKFDIAASSGLLDRIDAATGELQKS